MTKTNLTMKKNKCVVTAEGKSKIFKNSDEALEYLKQNDTNTYEQISNFLNDLNMACDMFDEINTF